MNLGESNRPLQPSRSSEPSNRPRGFPTEVNPNPRNYQESDQARAHRRENESADILAIAGYDIEQNPPPKENGKKPDYRIEGEYVDCFAPITEKVGNIYREIQTKVLEGQVDRVVVNLDDTPVTCEDLQNLFAEYPLPGFKEALIIKGSQIIARIISNS